MPTKCVGFFSPFFYYKEKHMMQISQSFDTSKVQITLHTAGLPLDHYPGEELPLFLPIKGQDLTYGVGYNSYRQRKALGMPYFGSGKKNRCRKAWDNMMRRCYGGRSPAYEGHRVCKSWLDYQEFAAWYHSQPEAYKPKSELDKNILDPLNMIYSPVHCTLVPKQINLLFKDSQKLRGRLPRGVYVHPSGLGFVARLSKNGKPLALGRFDLIEEAFEAFKKARQEYGKELAEQFYGQIDPRVIEILENLSAHIRD
jgi:hypothetical protein